jgi:hypothetical protein
MEVTYSSETLVDFQRTTRRYIPEDKLFKTEFRNQPTIRSFVTSASELISTNHKYTGWLNIFNWRIRNIYRIHSRNIIKDLI